MIVIASYLGTDPKLRRIKLETHLQQRALLRDHFPTLRIRSICSGYDAKERKKLKVFGGVTHFDRRTPKYKIHNLVMRKLYQSTEPKAVLFLDDDAFPHPIPEFPNIDPFKTLHLLLTEPERAPAPCIYFAAKNLVYDVYYQKRLQDYILCPKKCIGWAIYVRNDLQTMHNPTVLLPPGVGLDDVVKVKGTEMRVRYALEGLDDTSFRIQCALNGKLVLKHQRLFFHSLHGTSDKKSTAVEKFGDRKLHHVLFNRLLKKAHPTLFEEDKKGQLKPIWTCRKHARLVELVTMDVIRLVAPYGYVLVPENLHKLKVPKKPNRRKTLFE